jgi:hypothetical protein
MCIGYVTSNGRMIGNDKRRKMRKEVVQCSTVTSHYGAP